MTAEGEAGGTEGPGGPEGGQTGGPKGGQKAPEPRDTKSIIEKATADAREAAERTGAEAGEEATTGAEAEKRPLRTKFEVLGPEGDPLELTPELTEQKIRYTANGTEHERTLDELVRQAQFGHGVGQLREQRNEALQELETLKGQLEEYQGDRDVLLKILRDQSGESFKRVQEAFLKGGPGEGGQSSGPETEPPARDPEAGRAEAARIIQTTIHPYAEKLSEAYGHGNPEELVRAALSEFSQLPAALHNTDSMVEILQERLPALLEEAGYSLQATPPSISASDFQSGPAASGITPKGAPGSRESELEKENQRLRERLEAAGVKETQDALDGAPPAGGGGGDGTGPSGGSSLDQELSGLKNASSAQEMKEELRKLQAKGRRIGA